MLALIVALVNPIRSSWKRRRRSPASESAVLVRVLARNFWHGGRDHAPGIAGSVAMKHSSDQTGDTKVNIDFAA
jgi:hypothetical protein